MAKTYLSADKLRENFTYDPETGQFFRRTRSQKFKAGSQAGHLGAYGYTYIGFEKTKYLAHRLAFLYMTGEVPACDVDHINGDRVDNRWANLRAVSRGTNLQNQRKARIDNKSGFLGVHQINGPSGKWRARIVLNGKYYGAGCHPTAESAHQAYLELKRKLHEGCTI